MYPRLYLHIYLYLYLYLYYLYYRYYLHLPPWTLIYLYLPLSTSIYLYLPLSTSIYPSIHPSIHPSFQTYRKHNWTWHKHRWTLTLNKYINVRYININKHDTPRINMDIFISMKKQYGSWAAPKCTGEGHWRDDTSRADFGHLQMPGCGPGRKLNRTREMSCKDYLTWTR